MPTLRATNRRFWISMVTQSIVAQRNLARSSVCATPVWGAGLLLLVVALSAVTHAQTPSAVPVAKTSSPGATELKPLNRFPRMVQDWLVGTVRQLDVRNREKYADLASQSAAEQYVKSVRERIAACFGPMPERNDLKARVTKTHQRDGYRIENVIYESRPGLMVTGNLYVPTGQSPMPAVLGVCGHSVNGKAAEAYQSFAQGLARLGFVTFIIDPLGQGERLQYLGGTAKSRYAIGTGEHIQMGNAQTLVGEFLGSWFAWDAMRGLDYLLSRPEVDPQHIGVTGNSGGGTQTTWLCGLESRWTMAAPACFVTTFLRNLENELPQDTEQCPPRALALGLDHADFLAALAPKPTIVLAQERDYFDARGAEATHAKLSQLYHALGKSDQTQLHIGPEYHGYSQVNREAMYRFFSAVTGRPEVAAEPKLIIEKDETLWCTPEGQVGLIGSVTVPALTQQLSKQLTASRPKLAAAELKQAIRSVLRLPTKDEPIDYRILRSVGKRGYPTKAYCVYAVETEPGIQALATRLSAQDLMSRPTRGAQRAILYVAHRSTDSELRTEPLVKQLMSEEPESAFYACDVRGIGESQPDVCGADQFLRPYGSDYFHAAHSLMLDRPYLGQKTFDVLRVIEWLREQGHTEIHLAGRGWGALPATFAAVLSDEVKQVTLKNCLTSYADVAEDENYRWPYAVMLPGVLKQFDLPDCKRQLEPKSLRDLEPWMASDGMK